MADLFNRKFLLRKPHNYLDFYLGRVYIKANIPIDFDKGGSQGPAFFVGFLELDMRQTPLELKITNIVEPVVRDLGYALVLVKIVGEGGATAVQIMAENPETKTLPIDACASISRAISAVLDVEDPIKGRYNLEVSSPGIDRPLIRLQDFETYKGFEARIESDTTAENGQRKFRGILQGLDGDYIMISTEQGDAKIAYGSLTKAKLVLSEELIKKTANL